VATRRASTVNKSQIRYLGERGGEEDARNMLNLTALAPHSKGMPDRYLVQPLRNGFPAFWEFLGIPRNS